MRDGPTILAVYDLPFHANGQPSPLLAPHQHTEHHAHHSSIIPQGHRPNTHHRHPSTHPSHHQATATTTGVSSPTRNPITSPNPNQAIQSRVSGPPRPETIPVPSTESKEEAPVGGASVCTSAQPSPAGSPPPLVLCSCDGTGTAGRPDLDASVCMYTVPTATCDIAVSVPPRWSGGVEWAGVGWDATGISPARRLSWYPDLMVHHRTATESPPQI